MLHLNKTIIFILSFILATSFAGNVTTSPKATATLVSSCQISALNVNFGAIDPKTSASGVTATSSMALFCSRSTPYTVSLTFSHANYTVYVGCPSGCPNGYSQFNTYNPSGGVINSQYFINGTSSPDNYGKLLGAVSNDLIQYKITLPGDDSKLWSKGNYDYSNTGTGATQSFPIKATLTTSSYPTPDTYSDTVIASVSF